MLRNKIVNEEEMDKIKEELEKTDILKKKLVIDESLNSDENLITYDENTELLIVGTITPSKGKFYYCNPDARKNTLDLIFHCFGDSFQDEHIKTYCSNNLQELRHKISNEEVSPNELIAYLKKKKVAFIDIAKKVFRPKNSSSDSEFIFLSLDYDSFNKVFDDINEKKRDKKLLIIANSGSVEEGLNKIIENYNKINKENGKNITKKKDFKYEQLPQTRSKDLDKKWKDALKKHGII